MRVIQCSPIVLAAAMLGCAAAASVQSDASNTPSHAVEQFMMAASDSNITQMSQLWGTDKGSAASTGEPKEYGRRLVVMQAYLRGVAVRTVGEVQTPKTDRMLVTTELSRGPCKVTIPVTTVRTGNRWIVNEFDLARAGEVNKPCEGSGVPAGNTGD